MNPATSGGQGSSRLKWPACRANQIKARRITTRLDPVTHTDHAIAATRTRRRIRLLKLQVVRDGIQRGDVATDLNPIDDGDGIISAWARCDIRFQSGDFNRDQTIRVGGRQRSRGSVRHLAQDRLIAETNLSDCALGCAHRFKAEANQLLDSFREDRVCGQRQRNAKPANGQIVGVNNQGSFDGSLTLGGLREREQCRIESKTESDGVFVAVGDELHRQFHLAFSRGGHGDHAQLRRAQFDRHIGHLTGDGTEIIGDDHRVKTGVR